MDRRSFLKTSALGGSAAAASTLAAPVYAQGKKTLTMVTSWPRGFAVLDDAATYMENMVAEMSDGSLTIGPDVGQQRLSVVAVHTPSLDWVAWTAMVPSSLPRFADSCPTRSSSRCC